MSISTIDTVDIDGGAIDGTVIGGTTPAAGSFTTGSFTGDVGIGGIESPEAALDIRSNTNTTSGAKNIYIDCNNYNITTENGIVWKPKFSGYTKKSAGILFKPEADAFRGGLVFYTNDTATTSGSYEQKMHLDMNGNLELKSGTLSIINSTSTDPLISLKRKDDTYKLNIEIPSITTSDKTITFPNNDGTICVAAGSGLSLNASGEMSISTIDGIVIGGATPAAGSFTTLSATNGLTVTSGQTFNSDTVDIDGGAIDGTVIGGTTPAAGNFTTGSFTGDIDIKKETKDEFTLTLECDRNSLNGNPKAEILFKLPDYRTNFTGNANESKTWNASKIVSGWENNTSWLSSFISIQTHHTNPGGSTGDLQDTLKLKGGNVELSTSGKSTTVKGNLTVNGTTTLEGNLDLKGVLSASHIISEESIDIISNSLLINCNEHVMIDGDLQILGNNSKSKFNPKILFSENNISDEDFYIQYVGNEGSGPAGNRLRIGSGNSGWSSEAITILGNGKVGINTTDPGSSMLKVNGLTNSDSVFTLQSDRNLNTEYPKAIILFRAPDAGNGTGTYDASKIISGWEDDNKWYSSFISFQTHHSHPSGNTGDLQNTLKLKGGNVELSASDKSTTVKGNLTVQQDLLIKSQEYTDNNVTFAAEDMLKVHNNDNSNLYIQNLRSSGSMIIGKGNNILNINANDGRTTIATGNITGSSGYDHANAAIPSKTYRLYLQDGGDSGSLYAESDIKSNTKLIANTTEYTSDLRIKHNLQGLNNGLETILKLNPQIYFKTNKLYEKENHDFDLDSDGNPITEEEYTKEAGFIAQEIKEIDDIEYLVSGGDTIRENGEEIKEKYYLRYNDIFVYNVKATQELHQKNVDLENKVKQLEDKIDELTKIINEKLN